MPSTAWLAVYPAGVWLRPEVAARTIIAITARRGDCQWNISATHSIAWGSRNLESQKFFSTFDFRLTLPIPRRLYTTKSEYAQNRLPARLAGSACFEHPFAAAAATRLRDHVRDQRLVWRRTSRRGGLPLPGAAPYGRGRVDPRGMDHEGYRPAGPDLR